MGSFLAALPLAGIWILDIPLISVMPGGEWQICLQPTVVLAQQIVPAPDGTGTVVTPNGDRYTIQGGTVSKDGANLFHSFTRFNLDSGQTASFLSNPAIQNILTRIVGGSPSLINGLIQVTGGNSNLFIMNPAGIIFGREARLDVPGSFFATTAAGIGFGDRWFNAVGANDYTNLVGTPNAFYFPSQPGSIINTGELAVGLGQDITLLGGTVINTGKLKAPTGSIAVAAVPGEQLVRISQAGHLLSLEVSPQTATSNSSPTPLPFSPLSLPQLLTGQSAPQATGLTMNAQGQLVLTTSNQVIPVVTGAAIAAGIVDTSSPGANLGGNIYVIGEQVGLFGATIDASGSNGGQVFIGGDRQGGNNLPVASHTYIDRNSTIAADARAQGDGGRVTISARGATGFFGSIQARGGAISPRSMGAGGSVAVSGKESLVFDGKVDVTGGNGTLLLNSLNLTIADKSSQSSDDSFLSSNNSPSLIASKALETVAATNIVLEAANDIKIGNPLTLSANTGLISFTADADRDGSGSFSMNARDTLTTAGQAITISGANVTSGDITTQGGEITLRSNNYLTAGNLSSSNLQGVGGNITLQADQGNITANSLSTNGLTSAGAVALTAASGGITVQKASTEGATGGNISFNALADINATQISTAGNSKGGDIHLTSKAGSTMVGERVDSTSSSNVQTPAIQSTAKSGSAGNVTLDAQANVSVTAIDTRGPQSGGDIALTGKRGVGVGAIATNQGNITLTGDEINLQGGSNSVSGKGSLILQPASDSHNITIGAHGQTEPSTSGRNSGIGPDSDLNALDLTAEDLATLQPGFRSITIGRSSGSGTIAIVDGVTFHDSVTLQTPTGTGVIVATGNLVGASNGAITLTANRDIQLGNLSTQGGDLHLTSYQGNITANQLESAWGKGISGNISVNAQGNISVNNLLTTTYRAMESLSSRSASPSLKSGDVNLTSGAGKISIPQGIDTSATDTGGSITLQAVGPIATGNLNTRAAQGGTVQLTTSDTLAVGAIDTRGTQKGGTISLTGNEIDLLGGANSVASNGPLLLQPASSNQNIAIAGTGNNTTALNLTASDLAALRDGFTAITIGRNDGSGIITIPAEGGGVKFSDPTVIQAPASSGAIHAQGNITGTGDAAIALIGGEIRANAITSSAGITLSSSHGGIVAGTLSTRSAQDTAGAIRIQSAGAVELGNVNAFGVKRGGDIRIGAGSHIHTGVINSSSHSGNAGASTLTAPNDIEVVAVKAAGGGGTGGNVTITAGGMFRATGTFTDPNQVRASISTAGAKSGGSLTLRYGSANCTANPCTPTPFAVGNPRLNGTAGAITDGQFTVENRSVSNNFDLKAVGNPQKSLLSGSNSVTISVTNSTAGLTDVSQAAAVTGSGSTSVLKDNTSTDTASATSLNSQMVTNTIVRSDSELLTSTASTQRASTQNLTLTADSSTVLATQTGLGNSTGQTTNTSLGTQTSGQVLTSQSSGATTPRNASTSAETTGYIAPEVARNKSLNPANSVEMVLQIEHHRGQEFGKYFGGNFTEQSITAANIRETLSSITNVTGVKPAIIYVSAQPYQLELRLFLPEGKPIFKSIPVNRETVLQAVREFTNEIRNPRRLNSDRYLTSAQQLYQWLIAPLSAELEAQGVGTLLFSMDAGLRTLPMAALHDGQHFLVEKYSLGLIPSLSLTDTRYVDIRDSQVLAMGASEFPVQSDQNPLPAVPMELSAIVGNLWRGESFLNEDFTLANLKARRRQPQFQIIHLATHGEFQPGGAGNSYIQFWDGKLRLNQLRQLKLNDPPVELLVLSACSTAVGDEEAELGFAGLAVQAGVKSALASLWLVSDAGTLGLMAEFYQQLRTAPIKAEALRQAQLAMLRGQVRLQDGSLYYSGTRQGMRLPPGMARRGDQVLSHPYYWAAFTMIGSPW